MSRKIIAREDELKILEEIFTSKEPELLAVYGRRRIGKTFLISEFYQNKGVYFEITGMKNGNLKEQLFQFSCELTRCFGEDEKRSTPKTWAEAFHQLNYILDTISNDQKIILFFDEIPWLASRRSKFLNSLEHFWNRYLSRKDNIILIVCGSSASWIIRNIINNKGGLYGRVTRKLRLLPFTLSETEQYLHSRQIFLDRKQIIDLYMTLGGVPKYLSYVPRGQSASQAINFICFNINGGLHREFENLYRSLFENYHPHIAIVKALSSNRKGLIKSEVFAKAKITSGGTSTKILQELIDAGFIMHVPAHGKKKSGGIYRLIDEYSLFYLTWMNEIGQSIENIDPDYWLKQQQSNKWNSWSGVAFEAICLKHVQKLKKALGISGIATKESSWQFIPKQNTSDEGAQIDLLIDRADKCINLCEIKYSDAEYQIDKSYESTLQRKKNVFKQKSKTRKTLFITMISTYGVKKNARYLTCIDNQITMDQLF